MIEDRVIQVDRKFTQYAKPILAKNRVILVNRKLDLVYISLNIPRWIENRVISVNRKLGLAYISGNVPRWIEDRVIQVSIGFNQNSSNDI